MLIDGRTLPADTRLERDVCIIGAGAAGITLARQLGSHGARVALLESGGLEYEESTQNLYVGTEAGDILRPGISYLTTSRVRFFGGSTNHWSGWCRPLDALDFESRPWVPDSGWPFQRRELEPYYARAAPLVRVSPFDFSPQPALGAPPTILPGDSGIETTWVHVSRGPARFGTLYRDEIVRSPTIDLVLHANVLTLETDRERARVSHARVSSLEKNPFEVRAKFFVLAAGGLENPRLLLLSADENGRSLGNQNDLVGRYFMDHPHFTGNYLILPGRQRNLDLYTLDRSTRARGVLHLGEGVQREMRLLNSMYQVGAELEEGADVAHREVAGLFRALEQETPASGAQRGDHVGRLAIATEQSPNPESRVSLSDDRDALGQRRIRLDWKLTDLDLASVRASHRHIAHELGKRGIGRLSYNEDAVHPWQNAGWSHHHMGATRMHDDPRRGVVNRHARVHGVANLFVAGSSVFPTCGCSNPTLTLLALTVRLADHLRGELPG